jgi:hypothetical protein
MKKIYKECYKCGKIEKAPISVDVASTSYICSNCLSQPITKWRLDEWTDLSANPVPMPIAETEVAISYLRQNNYPKPEDCLGETCPGYRPSCELGVCYAATRLCGDF